MRILMPLAILLLPAAIPNGLAANTVVALPLVDPAVRAIPTCTPRFLSFRTPTDGWLGDSCGGLYRSRDGGRHFRPVEGNSSPLWGLPDPKVMESMIWFDDRVGVLFGPAGQVVRSSDGGESWHGRPLRFSYPASRTARVGTTVWLCDRQGALYRSDDRGEAWQKVGQTPAPWGCGSLWFGDRNHGWMTGSVTEGGGWETFDGGRHWTPIARLSGPPRVLPSWAESGLTKIDEHTTVRLEDGWIVHYRDGRRTGKRLVLSEPSGKHEQLTGILRDASEQPRWGWTERQIYRSDDDGASWFVLADSPEGPIDRIVLQNHVTAFLGTRSGKLYRATSGLVGWEKATGPIDRWYWSQQSPGSPAGPSPLACLSTAGKGTVKLDLVSTGCFSGSSSHVAIGWTRAGTTIVGDLRALAEIEHQIHLRLDPRAAAELRKQIATIVERGDEVPAGDSTSSLSVRVEWRCGEAPPQHLTVAASPCGSSDGPGLPCA